MDAIVAAGRTIFGELRATFALAGACLLLSLSATTVRAQGDSIEYAVKAAFLYKFAPFVEWPPAAMAPGAPLQLCVAGVDPFGSSLDQAVQGQSIGDHKIQVRRLDRVDGRTSCQVLYVRKSPRQSIADALAAVRGAPVLTVTDADDEDPARGVLHFVIAENRVRFEVDARAAAENGLSISSKLLSLALNLRTRE